MKKTNIPIKNNKPNNIFVITSIAILVFCCMGLVFLIFIQNNYQYDMKIIKVKYMNTVSITDNCGHPIEHLVPFLNISDVYEITIKTKYNGNELITNAKLIEKEKYIEDCLII